MVQFKITWMGEDGVVRSDLGRAEAEQIEEWNFRIKRAVELNDQTTTITVPTDGDSDRSNGTIRAILVKEIEMLVRRPANW